MALFGLKLEELEMFRTIGFIGTGNMGSALARAADKGAGQEVTLLLSNRTTQKAETLAGELTHASVSTNEEIAAQCDLIFLGVKPQMMGGLLEQLRPILSVRKDRFVLCSMAAGLILDRLTEMAGGEYPFIRILPNTPASIGQGIAQYCVRGITAEEKENFLTLMAPSGLLDEMDEGLMAVANCISGCGPAFAAIFMEALADGAVACGLPRDKAMTCAAQMLVGTGSMYLEEKRHPGAMKDAVCSPGGTTIQGVRALEEGGFRSAAMNAVIRAYEKTKAMG
jgi:pyrroline-5-carboxylate reductase